MEERIGRQLDELEALQSAYENELTLVTPEWVEHLRAVRAHTGATFQMELDPNRSLAMSLAMTVPRASGEWEEEAADGKRNVHVSMNLSFPHKYPDGGMCDARIVEATVAGAAVSRKSVIDLNARLRSFMENMYGQEAGFAAIGFVYEHVQYFEPGPEPANERNERPAGVYAADALSAAFGSD